MVIGGHNGSGVYRTVDIFDPDSGTWMPSDDAPASGISTRQRCWPMDASWSRAGVCQSSAVVASSAVFDPRAARGQMWAARRSDDGAGRPHRHPAAQRRCWSRAATAQPNTLQSAELFLPESRTWIAAPALAQPQGGHGATLLSSGRVFFSGSMSAF